MADPRIEQLEKRVAALERLLRNPLQLEEEVLLIDGVSITRDDIVRLKPVTREEMWKLYREQKDEEPDE